MTAGQTTPRFPSTLAPPAYYNGLEDRLRQTLLPVLDPYLTSGSTSSSPASPLRILELASGTGSHSILFTKTYSREQIAEIQPTECDEYGVDKIQETVDGAFSAAANRDDAGGPRQRIATARKLDVMDDEDWKALASAQEEPRYDLVFGSNFLHMIPFPEGPQRIFSSLSQHNLVTPSARLIFYGPFRPSSTAFFSGSDEKFNVEIAARPHDAPYTLGLRPLDELVDLAEKEGWTREAQHEIKANGNWVVVFRRS